MSKDSMARVSARTAAEVGARFSLGEAALGSLREGLDPRQYLDLLIEAREFPDAVRFLAHALPKREAVWWACRCARKTAGATPPAPIAAALRAAEEWVAVPSEENRRAAMPAAEAAGFGTPAGCAAVAAFWSGGSLGPPNVPAIPPGEYLTAHGASGSVMLAAVATEPEKAAEKYRAFLLEGIEIASGACPWPEPSPKEPPSVADSPAPLTASKASRPTLKWD